MGKLILTLIKSHCIALMYYCQLFFSFPFSFFLSFFFVSNRIFGPRPEGMFALIHHSCQLSLHTVHSAQAIDWFHFLSSFFAQINTNRKRQSSNHIITFNRRVIINCFIHFFYLVNCLILKFDSSCRTRHKQSPYHRNNNWLALPWSRRRLRQVGPWLQKRWNPWMFG